MARAEEIDTRTVRVVLTVADLERLVTAHVHGIVQDSGSNPIHIVTEIPDASELSRWPSVEGNVWITARTEDQRLWSALTSRFGEIFPEKQT